LKLAPSKSKPNVPKLMRCAVYTRKSTEHNLDLAFNSLDAQREACEAYVKSQTHEGWRLIPDRFDDGGLSGASLQRPALQCLLDEVLAYKIDIVVVYKVDRLTRSLADFAKLVELFDEHGVSFVSVTQSFNTSTSMGRLTLNVLLSFAQFEREVIGERVRDKIAASKKKGIWVGGPVPLGYRSKDKKLAVVPEEAELVVKIFREYLRLGSVRDLAAALNAEGLRPKPRPLANGSTVAAEHYRVGPLAYLLKNRFYIGEVVYRGEVNLGEQPAIIDRDLFEAVQSKLAEGAVARKLRRSQSPSILTGLLIDDRGHAMTPSHANKKGVRYRYYVSQALLQGRQQEAGSLARVSAPNIEAAVLGALRRGFDARTEEESDEDLIRRCVKQIAIGKDRLVIDLIEEAFEKLDPNGPSRMELPFRSNGPATKGVAHEPSPEAFLDERERDTLLRAIAKARGWVEAVASGQTPSFEAIASREKIAVRHVRRLAPLAFLAPRVIAAIADGVAPSGLTVSALTTALPHSWSAQERMMGLT
jgi:DNA invertase Pin-like site-specific DNA recombinase